MPEPDDGAALRRRPLPDRLEALAYALDTAHPRHEVANALRAMAEEERAEPYVSDALRSYATQLAVPLHSARISVGAVPLDDDPAEGAIAIANRLISYLRTGA